jgi:hypothetical protein
MFLRINDKGLIFNLGGTQYRTPMLMDISKQNLSKIIMALHLSGIKDFVITGSDGSESVKKSVQGGKPASVYHKSQLNDDAYLLISKMEERFKNFEKNLMKKIENSNTTSQEQISNLKRIELFMSQSYDQDASKKTFKKDADETEVFFIPDINTDMKLKGSSTETLSNKEDVNEAVNALASLLKK